MTVHHAFEPAVQSESATSSCRDRGTVSNVGTFFPYDAYTPDMTRILAAALLMLSLASCAKSETDAMRDQNATLKRQLEVVTAERDAFKARLEAVRSALEGKASVVTAPETASPATPPNSSAPVDPSVTPTPDSSATPAVPAPTPADPAITERTARLKTYADNVLSAAQNFKSQAGSEPPTDCSSGYKAGDYSVEKPVDALPECIVTTSGDGAYNVRLRDEGGQTVSVP